MRRSSCDCSRSQLGAWAVGSRPRQPRQGHCPRDSRVGLWHLDSSGLLRCQPAWSCSTSYCWCQASSSASASTLKRPRFNRVILESEPPHARCHPDPARIPGHPQCLAGQIPNVYDRKIVPCGPRDDELLGPVPLPCLIEDPSIPSSVYCRGDEDLTCVP
jgi:hypothetical protein